ncbi:type II toxin-antitoxin system ParD family antitoxin [Sphingomonas immobilis]|uniref:Type II toxin-antitoxin system ParD family antitoxin n=1 Tax=Sphingomonas immobilis TaxID=3063997 RepID=A0ABT9A0L2_9SPHN|nr:type II toxin-antitoxin system ParD family antitoxin [Sphingomonas sp. CA1-15]MDO7843371.1 type II toxin-antitoxin system ParD family antitoxin [Sphingomonas sp. CA1-15]
MAQINFSLPNGLKSWIDDTVAAGTYSSASDYLRELVRRDLEMREKDAQLREALEYGRASGPGTRTMEEILADGLRRRNAA